MNPLIVGGLVAGGVYLITRGSLGGFLGGSSGGAASGTVPETGTAQPGTAPPQGDLGGVTHDPGIVLPSAPDPVSSGGVTSNTGGPAVAPAAAVAKGAIVRDQRKAVVGDNTQRLAVRAASHEKRTGVVRSGVKVVDHRSCGSGCPSTPTSGKDDPHAVSRYITTNMNSAPFVY